MIRTLEVSTDSTKRHAGTNKLGDTAWDLIDNWGKNLSYTAVWMRKEKELGIMGREEDGLGPLYNLKRSFRVESTVTNLKHY